MDSGEAMNEQVHGKDEKGDLIIADWAHDNGDGSITPFKGEGPVHMHNTTATAWPLVTSGHLGVDHISVPAGAGFPPHTHPGAHLLIVIAGKGTITVDSKIYPTRAGQVYYIEGDHPHAVGAVEEHHILAVGSPHKGPDDPDRMALVEYTAIATELGEIECGVCGAKGRLDTIECPHIPLKAS
jgi:quercetin dioxygenase-like cupin family protein